jgi:hypothetical protein
MHVHLQKRIMICIVFALLRQLRSLAQQLNSILATDSPHCAVYYNKGLFTMALVPISLSAFGDKKFKRFSSYLFAANDAIVALVARELNRAAMVMPVAFAKVPEGYILVAVQGLSDGKNLFVAPDGRWLGRYIPSVYRGYPFVLVNAQDDKQVLCFDETSGLLSHTEGESFFDAEVPTKAVNDTLNFLTQVAVNRKATQRICDMLEQYQLIHPWPIELKQESLDGQNKSQKIEGLFRIDETAFNKLDAQALHNVQQVGALPVIFCQLLSMQHLPAIAELAKLRHQAEQQAALPKTETGEIDMSFLADDTTISFDNF